MQADTRTYPPLIGVDVSGGYKQDSSTITVVDSLTIKSNNVDIVEYGFVFPLI